MIGYVVEDNAQEKAVIELTRKIGIRTPGTLIRRMNGNRLRKGCKHARDMLSLGCAKVIVLKDMEGAAPNVEEHFREIGFPPQARLLVITREIETWFLADEEALRDYLGIRVEAFPEPEGIPDPKGELNRIFEKARGKRSGYHEAGTDPAEIAKRLRLETLERKCPSFRKFKKDVQEEGE